MENQLLFRILNSNVDLSSLKSIYERSLVLVDHVTQQHSTELFNIIQQTSQKMLIKK